MRFHDVIRSRRELRAVVGEPNPVVTRKTLTHLDDQGGVFIARSPDRRGRSAVECRLSGSRPPIMAPRTKAAPGAGRGLVAACCRG